MVFLFLFRFFTLHLKDVWIALDELSVAGGKASLIFELLGELATEKSKLAKRHISCTTERRRWQNE